MARDLRHHWAGLMGATALVLIAALVAPRFAVAPDLLENRRRAPAPAPPHDWATLRAWPKAADAWVVDHFPARPFLIGYLNRARLALGVSGSPKVIVGRDGWLFYDDGSHFGTARADPPFGDARARDWLLAMTARSEALKARGATYVILAAPDKETVYPEKGPAWYRGPAPNRPAALLSRLAAQAGTVEIVYPHAAMERPARLGLKVYGPHDTHWTGVGAYYGYAALMQRLHTLGVAEPPRPMDAFEETGLGNPNKPRNLAQMLGVSGFVAPDYPELGDADAEDRLRITYLTTSTDWTQPRVIDTGEAGKPVLLMTMDSFSNAFLPFLYRHFSRIVVAHNQDGTWREDLIARFSPDIVLLEVVESGLPHSAGVAPPPSAGGRARVEAALRAPHRIAAAFRYPHRRRSYEIGGTDGDDRLEGTYGDDLIMGRPGDDVADGRDGADHIYGGRGNDIIRAGPGRDHISGDRGDDTLSGGPNADVFHSFADAGLDRILDFSPIDRVVLTPGTAYTARQVGADTVVEMSGARVILVGVELAKLPPGWIGYR